MDEPKILDERGVAGAAPGAVRAMNWPATIARASATFLGGIAYGASLRETETAPERQRLALACQRTAAALVASERVLSEMIARDARWTEGEFISEWPSLELTERGELDGARMSRWEIARDCEMMLVGPPGDLIFAGVTATVAMRGADTVSATECVRALLRSATPTLAAQVEALSVRSVRERVVTVEEPGVSVRFEWFEGEHEWVVTARRHL